MCWSREWRIQASTDWGYVVSDVLFGAAVADMRRGNVRTFEVLLREGRFLLQQIMKSLDVQSEQHILRVRSLLCCISN